ncbi:class I SAM-dependent methyltransferase [Nocardia wallacei]|uniref:class I SAM-dependent methyltransferase n=2 Tax=Nocardia wallacei TaxID=480035 RepID=UPI0024584D5E|nr:class I SAM-dependent methyltransferase [Nocardia wallacei]
MERRADPALIAPIAAPVSTGRGSVAAMTAVVRMLYTLAYRLKITPWDTGRPPRELVDLVEGPSALTAGRALDIGCGTGTNVVYLARHGWDTTGIDLVGPAVAAARRKAEAADVDAVLVEADVTRLSDLDLGDRFQLILDLGCYHSLFPAGLREDYARAVTAVAAPGATLLLYGFLPGRKPAHTVTGDELRHRFPGWRLVGEDAGTNWLPTTAFRLRRNLSD